MGNRWSNCFQVRQGSAPSVACNTASPTRGLDEAAITQKIRIQDLTEPAAITQKIRIQDLTEPTGKMKWDCAKKPDVADHWKRQKCKHYGVPCKCEVFTCLENCQADFHGSHANGFFAAFFEAYNHHQDILLAPDDVWLVVCMHFATYINDNAEELRDKLVSHEGKKNLTVETWHEVSESEWGEFLTLMRSEIAKNTKDGIVEVLQSDFSTTTLVEEMISTACIMDSFKNYFSYGRCICGCGIRNACFLGNEEDWNKLLTKTENLKTYDIDGTWVRYIDGIQAILHKMMATYRGEVDVHWWNQVMHVEYRSVGSGGDYVTYIDGWILHFFGIYKQCDSDAIGQYSIDVPVKIDNQLTGKKKTIHMVGGFGAVHAMDVDGRKALRPQTSIIVYYDPTSKADADAAIEHFRQE